MKTASVILKILATSLFLLPFSSAFADRDHDEGHRDKHHDKHYNKHYEKYHDNRQYRHHPQRYEYYDNGQRYYSYYCQKHHHQMRCYDQNRRHPHFVYVPVTRVVQVVPAAPVTQYVETAPRVIESPRYSNVCGNCGVVVSINTVNVPGGTNGVGAVTGAVVGGLLGNQVGGGDGRKVATVAGAVVGGVVGNEIERNNSHSYTRYDVKIKMDNGSLQTMSYNQTPEWHRGDRVWLENGQISRRR